MVLGLGTRVSLLIQLLNNESVVFSAARCDFQLIVFGRMSTIVLNYMISSIRCRKFLRNKAVVLGEVNIIKLSFELTGEIAMSFDRLLPFATSVSTFFVFPTSIHAILSIHNSHLLLDHYSCPAWTLVRL